MEAFSLLKYWKATATGSGGAPPQLPLPTATVLTSVNDRHSDSNYNGGDDDGPFFDLEFAVPTEDDDNDNDNDDEEDDDYEDEDNFKEERETEIDEHDDDEEDEDEDGDVGDVEERELEPDLTFSPSDDLFFKGRILRIDGSEEMISSGNKTGQFPIPVSLVKSATKFRVFLLGLKRSKSESKQNQNKAPENQHAKKLFTVKFKVEEVPIFSLLTRASSNSKVNSNTSINKEEEQQQEQQKVDGSGSNSECSGDEKKNKKEVVQKYLKMVKPLYVKVSKKKQRGTAERREKMAEKQRLNLKVIAKKHLGKSKSAVVHSMVQQNTTSSERRDDSLLQQQDGIQSAILHCKRSFNSSKDFLDGEEASSLLLSQLVSDSLNEQKATAVAATMEEKQNGVVAA